MFWAHSRFSSPPRKTMSEFGARTARCCSKGSSWGMFQALAAVRRRRFGPEEEKGVRECPRCSSEPLRTSASGSAEMLDLGQLGSKPKQRHSAVLRAEMEEASWRMAQYRLLVTHGACTPLFTPSCGNLCWPIKDTNVNTNSLFFVCFRTSVIFLFFFSLGDEIKKTKHPKQRVRVKKRVCLRATFGFKVLYHHFNYETPEIKQNKPKNSKKVGWIFVVISLVDVLLYFYKAFCSIFHVNINFSHVFIFFPLLLFCFS